MIRRNILLAPDTGASGGGEGGDSAVAAELAAVKADIRSTFEGASMEAKKSLSALLDESKRSLGAEAKAAVAKIIEEATRSLGEAGEALKKDLERERAQAPGAQSGESGSHPAYRALKEAMVQAAGERRAITIGSTGNVQIVPTLVADAIKNYSKITAGLSYFYGPNADTVIPLIGVPDEATVDENGDITNDSATKLTVSEIKPKAHVVQLPISAETLLMSGANIEAQLPALFAKAFGKGMAKGALQGTGAGNAMTGAYLAGALALQETCAAAGNPTWTDLICLILDAKDMWDDAVLVLNPTFLSALISADNNDPLVTAFLMTGAIMGMQVIATGYAPKDTTSGAVVAIAMPLSNFGVGVAQQMVVEPIISSTSTQRLFRATMFYNGKPISANNGYALLAK